MYSIGKVLSWITNITTVIGGLVITLMMLHISLDVVMRYFFNTSLPGTITIVSYYYMIVAAFIPLAFAEQKDAHISVEVITEHLHPLIQKHLTNLAYLFSTAVFSLLTVRSWEEAEKKRGYGVSIVQGTDSISIWITYYILPLGCGLMALITLYKLSINIFGLNTGLDTERSSPTDIDPTINDAGASNE